MPLTLPKVIGHRGVRGYAPENTLAGLHAAADMGLSWVEFDVKLTKDGIPALFHDEDLHRITGHSGQFKDFTWADIQDLDGGSHFSDSFIGEPIPDLESALEVCINRGLGVNIELKPCPGREVETAEAALDYASRIWPDDVPQPLISSFYYPCLETALVMAPNWPRGFLIDESKDNLPDNWQELLKYIDPFSINCNGNAANDDDFATYLALDLPVLCYTINDPIRAEQLFDMGVSAVFSDVPDVIEEVL